MSWLDDHGAKYENRDTSGQVYKALNLKDKISTIFRGRAVKEKTGVNAMPSF